MIHVLSVIREIEYNRQNRVVSDVSDSIDGFVRLEISRLFHLTTFRALV